MKSKQILTLDIGGTKIKAARIKNGKVLTCQQYPTEKKSAKKFLANLEKIIKNLLDDQIKKIGIGTAGQIYENGKYVDFLPHFPEGLIKIPLKKRLEKKFGLPVKIDNDVHCFILAEHKYGAARGLANVIGLTLGTGIGGGIIINKKLYRGQNNIAGEFGHMIIDPVSNRRCCCGKRGDFETLAAGPALELWYKKIAGHKKSTYEISKAALKNDKQALEALKLQAKYLGVGISNLITIFNPQMVVIGGGIAEIKKLWPLLIKETKKNLPYKKLKHCRLTKAKLGTNAVLVGASLI
ncbi:MAG: ROK family protein [bacterium]